MTYRDFWQPLCQLYPETEAKAIGRMVMELRYGLTMTDIVLDKATALPHDELVTLQQRLLRGEPVQYVIGLSDFGPHIFHVAPGVLIPRPETYELCEWIVREYRDHPAPLAILDIGTGSGCIACTLAGALPAATVTAWDISDKALAIARGNAKRTHVHVSFEKHDIFCPPDDRQRWDVIVSNPPYICLREKRDMRPNVLDYEPPLALFVPDDDPFCFYHAIADYARHALRPGGSVFVECNPLLHGATSDMLKAGVGGHTTTNPDQFGKQRFVKVTQQ